MKILFLCVGNTCRSPMAEGILKNKISKVKLKKIKVRSCGISAEDGSPANPFALSVCAENGIDLAGFKAQKFNRRLSSWADVVICMTPKLKQSFKEEKFTDFTELYGLPPIADPYGGTLEDYRRAFYSINFACELLVKDFLNGQNENKK